VAGDGLSSGSGESAELSTEGKKVLAMFSQSVYRVTVRAWLPQADSGPQRLHQNWMTHNSETVPDNFESYTVVRKNKGKFTLDKICYQE
jgi:hypothetical protein